MENDDLTQARLYKSTIELIKKCKGHDSIADFLDKVVKEYASENNVSAGDGYMKKISDRLDSLDSKTQTNLGILIEIASKQGFIKG